MEPEKEKKIITWKQIRNLIILAVIPCVVAVIPCPNGLSYIAWVLFGIYIAAIVGLILKPFKEPVILLSAVALSALLITLIPIPLNDKKKPIIEMKDVLAGYASPTTWLVFSAFSLSVSFVVTGLGRRIAYKLIDKMGSSTLKLGYVNVILDVLLAPAMPSNTARAGGVITPIFVSISQALGSDPEQSPKLAGRYLLLNVYMVTKMTSCMFLTGMAPNALALQMINEVAPTFHLDWFQWFLCCLVPGTICLLLVPLVGYIFCRPELTKVDNKEIAKEGLEQLEPISKREIMLLVIFCIALIGWIVPSLFKILGIGKFLSRVNSTTVALLAMTSLLLTTVISWDDLLKSKGAWNTYIWYGGIIGLSSALAKLKFFIWLGDTIGEHGKSFNLGSGYLIFCFIMFFTVAIRYIFASGGAYVAAMVPVFILLGQALGAPIEMLGVGILFSNSYGGCLTHYGSAAAPVIFACGYNDTASWWKVGNIIGYGTLVIHCTIGYLWWWFLHSVNFY